MSIRNVAVLLVALVGFSFYDGWRLRREARGLTYRAHALMEDAMQQKATAWTFEIAGGCLTHVVLTTKEPGEDQAEFCRRHIQAVKSDAKEFVPKAGAAALAVEIEDGVVRVIPPNLAQRDDEPAGDG